MMRNVRGYVLAGGESSRMRAGGIAGDKALLQLEGETLLERSLRTLKGVCGEVRVLCGPVSRCERFSRYGGTIPDLVEGAGPLGGLDAALQEAAAAGAEFCLLVPVDQPMMSTAALQNLLQKAEESGAFVACFEAEDRAQPLPILMHTGAAAMVRRALEAGDYKLLPILRAAARELNRNGELFLVNTGGVDWFCNLNLPEDLAEVLRFRTARPTKASD